MATMIINGQKRYASCIGGILSVSKGKVTLVPTTFEWADEIDLERADRAIDRARAILADKSASGTDLVVAEAKLKRALVRKSVASHKAK